MEGNELSENQIADLMNNTLLDLGENESAKFWLHVLNELKNRGVQDILITSVDNLRGFSEAISACYPKSEQCYSVLVLFLQKRYFKKLMLLYHHESSSLTALIRPQ
jgi:Transposase, Mutator family